MRTWSATPAQIFWKLRWPSAVPFLFTSLKVAITISLIGAIVAELPTGAQAGIGARLLAGSYYGQTVQIWAALLAASVLSVGLIGVISLIERWVWRLMGGRAMRLDWRQAAFLAAALGVLIATALPLSSEPTAGLFGRPALLAAMLLIAALYAAAAFVPLRLSTSAAFAGVLLSCWVTLALLQDETIAGMRPTAFGCWC